MYCFFFYFLIYRLPPLPSTHPRSDQPIIAVAVGVVGADQGLVQRRRCPGLQRQVCLYFCRFEEIVTQWQQSSHVVMRCTLPGSVVGGVSAPTHTQRRSRSGGADWGLATVATGGAPDCVAWGPGVHRGYQKNNG